MIIIDSNALESARQVLGYNSSYGRFEIATNMFERAHDFIIENNYAIAVDQYGNEQFAMRFDITAYIHSYIYTGELDMSLLNSYDCLILNDCNDYAIELYVTALRLWEGNRVILVGKNWRYFLDIIPHHQGVETIYEEKFIPEKMANHIFSKKTLCIMYGNPHAEPLDRYKSHILYYDEVMFFTFLFADKREFGNENPDKKFVIIDARYGNLGLFALRSQAIAYARYIKAKGFIPVFNIQNIHGSLSIYQDYRGDEIWNKFFTQPEEYTIDNLINSKNVYFTPECYNPTVISHIMSVYNSSINLSWINGLYSMNLKNYIEERKDQFLPYPNETLGVLARGTDFVNAHLDNHPTHVSKEVLRDKIEQALKKWNLKYIYLATEDESYLKYFKKEFGDIVYSTDQQRFTTKENEMLAEMHRKRKIKGKGFTLGAEYILSILLLSECNSLLASGSCSGVSAAINMNTGIYKNIYVHKDSTDIDSLIKN